MSGIFNIYLLIYHKHQLNVGEYTMDPMGRAVQKRDFPMTSAPHPIQKPPRTPKHLRSVEQQTTDKKTPASTRCPGSTYKWGEIAVLVARFVHPSYQFIMPFTGAHLVALQ